MVNVVLVGDDGSTVEIASGTQALPLTVLSPEFPGNTGVLIPILGGAGPRGETGPQGPPGAAGPQGETGTYEFDGVAWFFGSGPPTPSPVGAKEGDYYIDTSTGAFYVLGGS